jgi:hypothetical protein
VSVSAFFLSGGYVRCSFLVRMWPISRRVNKPENDDPWIVEPVELCHLPNANREGLVGWRSAFLVLVIQWAEVVGLRIIRTDRARRDIMGDRGQPDAHAKLTNATRTPPESLSPVGGAEIRQDRRKIILFNVILAEAEAFSHHPRIEHPCPNSRQWLPCGGQRKVSDATAATQPGDACPSLSAAVVAAVTRNPWNCFPTSDVFRRICRSDATRPRPWIRSGCQVAARGRAAAIAWLRYATVKCQDFNPYRTMFNAGSSTNYSGLNNALKLAHCGP